MYSLFLYFEDQPGWKRHFVAFLISTNQRSHFILFLDHLSKCILFPPSMAARAKDTNWLCPKVRSAGESVLLVCNCFNLFSVFVVQPVSWWLTTRQTLSALTAFKRGMALANQQTALNVIGSGTVTDVRPLSARTATRRGSSFQSPNFVIKSV